MIALLVAAAIFVQAPHHQCRVPAAAWQEKDLTAAEFNAMEKFGQCICGPEGTVDWDPRPHYRGGYFMHPSCNRDGWNGHRYIERSKRRDAQAQHRRFSWMK